jgi:hypothetical protein
MPPQIKAEKLVVMRHGQLLTILHNEIHGQEHKDDKGVVKIMVQPGNVNKAAAKVAGKASKGIGKAPKVSGGLRRIKAAFKTAFRNLPLAVLVRAVSLVAPGSHSIICRLRDWD